MVHVGQRLSLLREALGLTQNQVAKSLNISRQYITKIEKSDNSVAEGISASLKKEICNVLGTTEEWLYHGLGFAYRPRSHADYVNFYTRQLKIADKIVFINNIRSLEGYCFVCQGRSVTMRAKIYDPSLLPQAKKLYEVVIELYAYKQMLDFMAFLNLGEKKLEILVAEYEYQEDDDYFNKTNFDNIADFAERKENFLRIQQEAISTTEYRLAMSFDFQPTKNELFLLEKIREKNFDIYALMKFIDFPYRNDKTLKDFIKDMTVEEMEKLNKEVIVYEV